MGDIRENSRTQTSKLSPIRKSGKTGKIVNHQLEEDANSRRKARFQPFKAGSTVAFFLCPVLILVFFFSVEISALAVTRWVTTALGHFKAPCRGNNMTSRQSHLNEPMHQAIHLHVAWPRGHSVWTAFPRVWWQLWCHWPPPVVDNNQIKHLGQLTKLLRVKKRKSREWDVRGGFSKLWHICGSLAAMHKALRMSGEGLSCHFPEPWDSGSNNKTSNELTAKLGRGSSSYTQQNKQILQSLEQWLYKLTNDSNFKQKPK